MESSGKKQGDSPFPSIGGALVRDAGPLFGVRLVGAVVNFTVLLLLIHRMPEEDVGLYYFLVNLWNILNVLVDFGGEPIATREIAARPDQEGSILRDFLTSKLWLAVLGLAVFGAVVCGMIEKPTYRTSFLLTAAVLPGFYLGSFSVVFRVRHRMRWPALALLIGHVLFLAGSLAALLVLETNVCRFRALALAFSLGNLMGGVLIYLLARSHVPAMTPGEGALRFLSRSYPQGIAALAGILYFYVDTLMIKAMLGDAQAGYYNSAYRLLNFFIYAAGVISISVMPALTRALKEDSQRLHRIFRATLSFLLLIAVPICAFGTAQAREIMTFLYGEKMAVYHVAVPTLRILLLAGVFTFAGSLGSITLVTLGRQDLWMRIAILALAVNVGMNLGFIPVWGHMGAAWATLATEFLVTLLCLLLVWRLAGLTPEWTRIFRMLLLGLVVFATGFMLKTLMIVVATLITMAVFLGGAAWLRLYPSQLFQMKLLRGLDQKSGQS